MLGFRLKTGIFKSPPDSLLTEKGAERLSMAAMKSAYP
jgi:hypothetical protein